MAQATNILTARSQLLRYDHAMLDELVEVTTEWDSLAEGERTSWLMDWDQFALEDVPRLAKYAASNGLSDEQMTRYNRLLQRIEEHKDLIQRFNLTMPQIPTEVEAE